jgi:nucleoside-triphosphatase
MITGNPGVGKTTFMLHLNEHLKEYYLINGFYTKEIRHSGQRFGFNITTFQGIEKVLASVDMKSQYRVGRYGVSVSNVDDIINYMRDLVDPPEIWLIDEIGKMESFSIVFRSFIKKILEEEIPVIATIAKSAGGWISQIRQRDDITLLELTYQNREQFFYNFIQKNFLNQNSDSIRK